jgi:hypothetical protein
VVIGRLGNDDIEGEGGDDVIVGANVGTDRHLGNLGFDWLTYYGQTADVTSDWAFNRVFETQNQLCRVVPETTPSADRSSSPTTSPP